MLKFENVRKKYNADKELSDLSFEIKENGVYALLGNKRAGVSALLDMAAGCLAPDEGVISLNGVDIYANPAAAKMKIGYFPREDCFFPEMTVIEFLLFVGDAKRVNREKLYRRIDEIMEISGLEDVGGRLVKNLDTVSKKRLGLAMTVLGNPDIIIFDRLFDDLPRNRAAEFKTLVKMFGEMKPVIISFSSPDGALEICDGAICLPAGKFLLRSDTEEDFETYLFESEDDEISDEDTKSAEEKSKTQKTDKRKTEVEN